MADTKISALTELAVAPDAAADWIPIVDTDAAETKRITRDNLLSGLTLAASAITAGTLVHEQGGLEADVSAYAGLLKITGGATSAVTAPTGDVVGTTDTQTLTNKTLTDILTSAATELTIATGDVTVTQAYHIIDTEADAASDNLDGINGGAAGQVLIIRPANDARTVVVRHNQSAAAADNILIPGGSDVTLDDEEDCLLLLYDAILDTNGAWIVMAQFSAGGLANVVEDVTPQLGGMLDVNGQAIGDGTLELLAFVETGSAINEITVTNAATGGNPSLSATGDDAVVHLELIAKGATGRIIVPDGDTFPGIGFTGATGTGIARSGAELHIFINNTARHKFAAANVYPAVDNAVDLGVAAARWYRQIYQKGFHEMVEMTAPTGLANAGRIFAQDNGGGKTQLMVIFGTGVAQQLAIEP